MTIFFIKKGLCNVCFILNDFLFVDWHVWFTMVPFKPLTKKDVLILIAEETTRKLYTPADIHFYLNLHLFY